MKKAVLFLLVIILLMSAACSAEKAEISASTTSPENTAVADNKKNPTATDSPENTAETVTAVTDNAQELDSGYTFTLNWEYVDIPRQAFEIDVTGGIS